jgi:hypothetical protein
MQRYDFFVSCKHAMHSTEAHEIKRILNDRGYTAWIDTEQSHKEMADGELTEHLLRALEACSYVVFFETYAQMAMQIGGPEIRVYSWQERELGMTNIDRIAILYHSQSKLAFGKKPQFFVYNSLDEAVDLIEDGIRNGELAG